MQSDLGHTITLWIATNADKIVVMFGVIVVGSLVWLMFNE